MSNDDIKLDIFSTFYRKDGTRHSCGILVYVSDQLISKRKFELEDYLQESLWIELRNKHTKQLICTVYRQPDAPVEFWNKMNICLEKPLNNVAE